MPAFSLCRSPPRTLLILITKNINIISQQLQLLPINLSLFITLLRHNITGEQNHSHTHTLLQTFNFGTPAIFDGKNKTIIFFNCFRRFFGCRKVTRVLARKRATRTSFTRRGARSTELKMFEFRIRTTFLSYYRFLWQLSLCSISIACIEATNYLMMRTKTVMYHVRMLILL